MSAFVDPTTRISLIAGIANNNFQIPNVSRSAATSGVPSPTPSATTNFNSALLNENQNESTQFDVLPAQKSYEGFDGQLSYFTRYNNLHFLPDPIGDLLINGIASNVYRTAYINGIQGDGSYQLNSSHTLRSGFSVSSEQAFVGNTSLVEPCMVCDGSDNGNPVSITDNVSKTGLLLGVYVQDEWKITNHFTMNAGLRFDQMEQFVNANQFSPRLSFTYKPFENTTFHAGYARYFTPPELVEAAPANISLFKNTTAQHRDRTIRCCRSAHIISMPASIKRSNSDAPQMGKPAPISISASMPTTRSLPISSITAFSARPWC